jgi:hypothetical protein
MLLDPLSHLLSLPFYDVHSLIRIVQVIPSRTLVRWITRPHHSKLIHDLRFRTPDTAVRPGGGADVGSVSEEERHCGGDNSLENTTSAQTKHIARVATYLKIRILMRRSRRGQVRILLILILPIIPRHAKLLQKHRLANILGPATAIGEERGREVLRRFQIRRTRVVA